MVKCGSAGCTVHNLAGRLALPCADGKAMYEIPDTEFGQTLGDLVAGFERYLVEHALTRHDGSVTKAAQDLGMKRQALTQILRGRLRVIGGLAVWKVRGRNKSDEAEEIESAEGAGSSGEAVSVNP